MFKNMNLIKKITTLRAGLVLGLGALLVGCVLIAASFYGTWRSEHSASKPVRVAFSSNKAADNGHPTVSGTPVHISIPSVNIDLQVIPGYYYPQSNSWTLSLNDAQYATMTAPANDKGGLTFIYAHYRLHVFYTLPKVQQGAIATVTTANGHVFTYTFRDSVITNPQDTSLFTYQGKPILVLQTCTGLWYQNRQLFTFNLTKVS